MALWKRIQEQKVLGKRYTRAKALGRKKFGIFKDLKKDPRGCNRVREAATRLLRLAVPGPAALVGHSEECGFLVSRALRSRGRVLSRGAM